MVENISKELGMFFERNFIFQKAYNICFHSDPSGGETELLTKNVNFFKLTKSESADHFEHSLEKIL